LEACAAFAADVARQFLTWEPAEKNTTEAKLAAFREEAVYAAFDSGEIVGVISLWEPDAFVHFLFCRPQGRGIGPALLRTAAGVFDRPISLKCAKANRDALRFYSREGFVPIARGEDAGQGWVRLQAPYYHAGVGLARARREPGGRPGR